MHDLQKPRRPHHRFKWLVAAEALTEPRVFAARYAGVDPRRDHRALERGPRGLFERRPLISLSRRARTRSGRNPVARETPC